MHTIVAATAFALGLAGVAAGQGQDKTDDPLQPAMELLRAGKVSEALVALDASIAAFETRYKGEKRLLFCGPNTTEALLYTTIGSTAKKDTIVIEPSWCEALFLKGYALSDQRRFDEAIPFLERAVEKAPQHAHYLNELGYAYQQSRNLPKSLEIYRRAQAAAELADEDTAEEAGRALRGIGYDLVEMGDWKGAEAAYNEALKRNPDDERSKGELRYIAEHRPR